jgi:O-antigen/teichoic acid export membrane protein
MPRLAGLRKLGSRRPHGFTLHVGFNGLAQIAPIAVALALTPLLISRLGASQFGIWSLALVTVSTLTSLDGGVSASLARFFAIHAARDDRADAGRLLLAALLFFLALGVVLTLLAYVFAPTLVGFLHVPRTLEGEALWVVRWLPLLTTFALFSDATAALLQGNAQFRELAIASSLSSGVFVIAVLVLVQPGGNLHGLMAAATLRFAAMAVIGLFFARKRIAVRRPLLPPWSTIREVGSYASRMQVAAATGFVNAELDAFVIAAVSPVRYVGLYSIGLQAASAARSIPLYAFSPLLTRLTTTFRRQGRDAAADEFERLERIWLPSVFGFGVVAIAAIGFSVTVWLGNDYVLSGVTAAVLLTGFIVHVGLTGMRTCYVRAVGRPGLEARCSAVWSVCNALLTVPLALLAGMVGVVGATAGTGIVASIYFVSLCRRAERLPLIAPRRRWWLFAGIAACVTIAGELAVLRSGLDGFVGLAVTGIPPLVGLALFGAAERRHSQSRKAQLERVTST